MEESTQTLPPPATLELEPISRPNSTSTHPSPPQNGQQLPNLSALADASSVTDSLQPRPVTIAPAIHPPGTSPASTHPGPNGNLPTCQNCETSTTPLWRRDEMGSVLCNACGLFLKLHGRPRPISLKTDVIKSRNRVKTMRPDLAKQKKQQNQGLVAVGDMNGADQNGVRRPSQKSNGQVDDTNSPISRTGTPNMYNAHMAPMYHTLDDQYQAQQLAGFSVAGAAEGQAPSPLNGDPSHDQLMTENASLKTRVSELEVIQELYRGRLHQLEEEEKARQGQEAAKIEQQLRAQNDMLNESHVQLQKELEESHRRENMLKRRLDELEVELRNAKESPVEPQENGHVAKRARIEEEAPKPESLQESVTPEALS
ncbi:hypothetical protein B0H66DRAFT_263901 [Apodospora peruviana]|uniref:GATA-type domain-containing protein n=1 Tax=Apodospora peruviana TaxID=516989 RepID=A0AAE0I668_9PEZI|nr:hypothetical protein B0H66DRAFT_263901 [Apodospora peruviana]